MGAFRWIGGKAKLASRIAGIIPPGGRPYCEPFCGAASVLLCRAPAGVEVINDIDDRIVNLFRCLRDDQLSEKLIQMLELTPYSREEFSHAIEVLQDGVDPVERAWAFIVVTGQAFSGRAGRDVGRYNWGVAKTHNNTRPWGKLPNNLRRVAERIKRCHIESMDGIDCIRMYDSEDTIFYVDPPYHPDVVRSNRYYQQCVNGQYHERLVHALRKVKGYVALSCYDHPVYEPLMSWHRFEFDVQCSAIGMIDGTKERGRASYGTRKEVLLVNRRPARPLVAENGHGGPSLADADGVGSLSG